ncbi:HIRAN domain-containing protein [Acidithiobacillus ferrooxidans]|uniref:HIRAN domain-containing protein n=1 Tax=Acidithiobacillus TaxID=119977 RepID=UPI001C06D99C|nr:HIRAN domain-containing protein [Acidithiobacillus ferridurans]MBU2805362.1 hypothetical protein [Acidithiobacillus ferridurans]
MNLIERTFNPTRLLLAWQTPKGGPLYSVGELIQRNDQTDFRYLIGTDDFQAAADQGFSGYSAFPLRKGEFTDGVMDVFMRRLPPRKRGDFAQYLEKFRLSPDADLSDFALLGYSGAKLPSDSFSVLWPMDDITAPAEVLLDVAGFRYQNVSMKDLSIGMMVSFIPEPENEIDNGAIRIETSGRRIGYVKRAQCDAVRTWIDRYVIEAQLERFNGTPERPVIYVFCRLRSAS